MARSGDDDRDDLIGELTAALGAHDVLVDHDVRRRYEVDWTGRYAGAAVAAVRPRSAAAVGDVARLCGRFGAAIVPQGGNTGLVGGSVPSAESTRPVVVVSTAGLDQIGDVDAATMQVTAGAGVTIAAWRDTARSAGLDTPVDFAARDSATIGGAIATNAGGSRVVRFGTMRAQVVGVEAVLADGSRVGSLDGLAKETVGLHWPSLLAGSEGTLGIVTAARLRLVPWFRRIVTAMVAVDSIGDALELLRRLRADVTSLDAVELVLPAALDLVTDHLGTDAPVERPPDAGAIVIVECAAHDDPAEDLFAVLADVAVADSAVATEPGPRQRLLDVRDRLTESIAAASTEIGTPTFKLDVAVPVGRLAELLDVAASAAFDDGCTLIPFGHLAEGNVHLNHLGARHPEAIAARVLAEVARLGGTISAEHGIGRAKTEYLGLVRSEPDLDAQRTVKLALDPDRILNPGVLGR